MKWLRRIFDFYLDASVHVALAVFSLVGCSGLILNIPIPDPLAFFLFFASISCYNFVKYGVEAEKYVKVANRYHKNIQFLSIGCLLIATYFAFFLRTETWFGIALLLALTGLYALPVLPGTKNLRSWGGLKIVLVALVWAGATVLLPVVEVGKMLSWDVSIEFVQRLLLVLVLLVPFEIRDLTYDAPDLKTLPQRYGVVTTKWLAVFTLVVLFLLTFIKDRVSQMELIGKSLLCLVLGMALLYTNTKQSRYFASFWVEGIPIFWYGILLGMAYW